MRVEPQRLRFLLAVARAGGVLAAADELGVTASAVSQQLTRLEQETGRTLLQRTATGSVLTPAGLALAEAAEDVERALSASDFTLGDLIDLSRIDANGDAAGEGAFSFIGTAAFSGTRGELRFQNQGGPIWLVQGDTDGNGVSDFEVVLVINPPDPITSSDFIL